MAMFLNSFKLLLEGKLFREPLQVARQWLIGFAAAFVLLIVLVKLGLPLWLAVVLVVLCTGALQPWLFRHLKCN